MKPILTFLTILIASIILNLQGEIALAQKVEINDNMETVEVDGDAYKEPSAKPRTGKGAAQKYFKKQKSSDEETDDSSSSTVTPTDHYMMFGIGAFIDSKSYRWGDRTIDDPGKFNFDVTYRFGEWVNSMDFLVRLDFQTYDVETDKDPMKLSFVPTIIFPDASSKFPVYFGAGAGLGVFFKQIDDESSLSFDYQLFLGARVFDIIENFGFFTELGLKNHIHLLTSGQYNGVFFNIGTVSTF